MPEGRQDGPGWLARRRQKRRLERMDPGDSQEKQAERGDLDSVVAKKEHAHAANTWKMFGGGGRADRCPRWS